MSSSNDEDLIVPKKWHEALPRRSWERFNKTETGYPWFEVYEVTPNTYAIYEPGQFQEVISYLALGKEKAALIDTGYGMSDMRGLVELLTDLPVTVVITHTHVDHIGQNYARDEFIESYLKMVDLSEHYDWLMPSHNETYVDKEIISRVLKASEDIKAGEGGEYREQNRRGTLIHRYDYEGFAIIVKAPTS